MGSDLGIPSPTRSSYAGVTAWAVNLVRPQNRSVR